MLFFKSYFKLNEILTQFFNISRYRYHESDDMGASDYKETTNLVSLKDKPTVSKLFAQMFNPRGLKTPTPTTSRLVSVEVLLFCMLNSQ